LLFPNIHTPASFQAQNARFSSLFTFLCETFKKTKVTFGLGRISKLYDRDFHVSTCSKKGASKLSVDKENASKILQTEWNYVEARQDKNFLSTQLYKQEIQWIKEIIRGKQLTYKYILLTAALAKATNPLVHYRVLQKGSQLQGAYDARSLAHGVVVPFEKSHGERFGGSNEPFLNRPARYPEFDLSNRDRNRNAQKRLFYLLDNCQRYSTRDKTLPKAILRQVLKEMINLQPTKRDFKIPPVKVSLQATVKIVNEFLQVSGSGERLVAVIAAVFASMCKIFGETFQVRVYPVNWPDKFAKTAGDIEFYKDGKIVRAVEVKDKPISESDLRHCQMKAKRHGITEYIILAGAGIVTNDESAITEFINSQLKHGINLYILAVPQQLFPYFVYLGEKGRKVFLTKVGTYLNEIKATRTNKKSWQQLINKYLK
jgi:hypothetical protein